MAEPVYFVVRRGLDSRPMPALYYDLRPRDRHGIEYEVRLDQLPGGADLVTWPLDRLYQSYLTFKAHGKLPPSEGTK